MAKNFVFEISLSVLNHLGRNLYRRFTTVLGEAVSNSWDADAYNVYIDIDKENNSLVIKDDGCGMTSDEFQEKFLRIGYSKRKNGKNKTSKGRPFIGRKGIGKLALLSCADKITVISKVKNGSYIGGTIDNSELDTAIKDDLKVGEYNLKNFDKHEVSKYIDGHKQGTIIKFQNVKSSISNTDTYLKKILALYLRFSLLDNKFNIYLNSNLITYKDLSSLAKNTQFLWVINHYEDPFINQFRKRKKWTFKKRKNITKRSIQIKGFIASVNKPRDLTINTLEERVTFDLFVNGRLRDKNILRHIPTARIAENYLYGQIHFNELDDETDRFTSSREGVIADDPKYKTFLEKIKEILNTVVTDWDKFRREERQPGDPENKEITPQERKAEELSNIITNELFDLPDDPQKRLRTEQWIREIESKLDTVSYIKCFILENLFRKFVKENNINLDKKAKDDVRKFRETEKKAKKEGNVNISIREDNDLNYLDLHSLSRLVDPEYGRGRTVQDVKAYKPIRDALMHTAILTKKAKNKLETIYDNMKGRLEELFRQ